LGLGRRRAIFGVKKADVVGVGVVGRVGLGNELAVSVLWNGSQVRQLQWLVFHCHHIRIVYLPVLIDSDV